MSILIAAGWSTWGLFVLLLLVFAFVSLVENERTAFLRSLSAGAASLIGLGGIFWLGPDIGRLILALLALAVAAPAVGFLISPRPRRRLAITGKPARIDERDTIFSRFSLQDGSERKSEYYTRRPDLREIDDRIRAKPQIDHPDFFREHPVLRGLAQAQDANLKRQLELVDGPVSGERTGGSPERNSRIIKEVVRYLGAPLCGIAELDRSFMYSHTGRGPESYGSIIDSTHRYAVVFAVEMKMDMVATAPGPAVYTETETRYSDAARISIAAAGFLRRLGWPSRAHVSGSNYQAMLPPLAWRAGLGEMGRMGILITPRYGPRVRLGMVTTEMPLTIDSPIAFGVQDFCRRCQKCADNCPSGAIPSGDPEEDNGVVRWVIRREACYSFWGKAGSDCSRCLFVCPYSKPDNLLHNTIRRAAARSIGAQRLFIKADDWFYGRRPRARKQKNISALTLEERVEADRIHP